MRQKAVKVMATKRLTGLVIFGWYGAGKTALILRFIDGVFNDKYLYEPDGYVQAWTKHGYQYTPPVPETAEQNSVAGEVEATESSLPEQAQEQAQEREPEREREDERDADSHSHPETVDYLIYEATETGCHYSRRDWVYTQKDVVMLTYSITNTHTFKTARQILVRAREQKSKAKIFLVGLQADCEKTREVSFEHGEELAREFEVDFRELSALEDGEGVERLFADVARFMVLKAKMKRLTLWQRIKALMPWPSS
ncbi:P-loop containing nucleoside triphosphate hydrolase protein [Aspergillus carlsbadensis]|nr:P-loop containing nucleoside triphosphate hydrolase protein [Aspergillus carlsbadensis]